jgi:hypothetical protein
MTTQHEPIAEQHRTKRGTHQSNLPPGAVAVTLSVINGSINLYHLTRRPRK